jgi:alpha-beta hydrolase superfamily lysophospholipase
VQGTAKPLLYLGSWIERLNSAGISVAGFDMQGCGFSEGLRGLRSFFESFEDVIADAVQFRRWAVERVAGRCTVLKCKFVQSHSQYWVCRLIPGCGLPGFSGVPVFLAGISLGGCVAIHVMQRHVSSHSFCRLQPANVVTSKRLALQG